MSVMPNDNVVRPSSRLIERRSPASGALVAVPLVAVPLVVVPLVAVAVSLVAGWRFPVQVGDTAWLTQRVDDVWSTSPPLVGMPSTLGGGELATHHPGPIQFYWLAPWWQLVGHRGIALGSAAGAAVALVWIGQAVRSLRGAGLGAALAVQVGVAVGALTISPELFADPWNPFAALPWGVLLVVSATRVHCEDRRGWLGVGVGATVATQLHAGYLPWALALLVALVVALAIPRWRTRAPSESSPSEPSPSEPSATRFVMRDRLRGVGLASQNAGGVLAIGVTSVLWLPPLIDLVVGIHNPVLLARAAFGGGAGSAGATEGTAAEAVGVAAASALSPLHRALDAVWIVPQIELVELLVLVGSVAAIGATWWFARRDAWPRAVLTWAGGATILWLLVAARAPLADGLLAHSYVRPLWPLGALLWIAVGAEWWSRRPGRLARAWWIPAVVVVAWAATTPRGYVGIDPASRTRGREIAEAVADLAVPHDGLTLHARGPVASTWIAPAITATLDRRGVPNGIGTDPEWDHPGMSTRPSPLPGTTCEWWVGDRDELRRPDGPLDDGSEGDPLAHGRLVVGPRPTAASESAELSSLQRELSERFARLEPSRFARAKQARGNDPIPSAATAELLSSGVFADLVVAGLLEGATLRDPAVAAYVERSRLAAPGWEEVVVVERSCAAAGTP